MLYRYIIYEIYDYLYAHNLRLMVMYRSDDMINQYIASITTNVRLIAKSNLKKELYDRSRLPVLFITFDMKTDMKNDIIIRFYELFNRKYEFDYTIFSNSNAKFFGYLLSLYARFVKKPIGFNKLLYEAAIFGKIRNIKYIIANYDVATHLRKRKRSNDNRYEQGLYGVCEGGHMKAVKWFIKNGVNNWPEALPYACNRMNNKRIVRMAIKELEGMKLNWRPKMDMLMRSFGITYRKSNLGIFKILAEHYSYYIGQTDNLGVRIRCLAKSNLKFVEYFFSKGYNIWDTYGYEIIRKIFFKNVCFERNIKVFKFLVSKGYNYWLEGIKFTQDGEFLKVILKYANEHLNENDYAHCLGYMCNCVSSISGYNKNLVKVLCDHMNDNNITVYCRCGKSSLEHYNMLFFKKKALAKKRIDQHNRHYIHKCNHNKGISDKVMEALLTNDSNRVHLCCGCGQYLFSN